MFIVDREKKQSTVEANVCVKVAEFLNATINWKKRYKMIWKSERPEKDRQTIQVAIHIHFSSSNTL
jgi:hypothetical protein